MADNQVKIKITADTQGVESGTRRASDAISKMDRDLGSAGQGGGAVARAAREMANQLNGSAAAAAGLANSLSRVDGMAVSAFQGSGVADFTQALLGAGAAAAGLSKLVSVEREFGNLNAQLKTATGSAELAKAKFAELQGLAGDLPESLADTVGAFVKLKNLGLDPSAKAIESYANTAAAVGKPLTQMIEAVADAATGEMERLKEFGITAQKNGEEFQLTFQGVTTTVKNNAQEIEGYLRRLGEVQFAGAAAEKMATMEGAISNLGDAWDGTFRKINDSGVGGAMTATIRVVADNMDTLAVVAGGLAAVLSGRVVASMAQAAQAALATSVASREAARDAALQAQSALQRAAAEKSAADAKLLAARNATLATQQQIADDRARLASTIQVIKAEIELEQVRLRAQISDTGRAARVREMAALSLQLAAAERAQASVGSQLVAVRQAQTLATEAAAVASGHLAQAQIVANSTAQAAGAGVSMLGRAVGLLGGPIGVVTTLLMAGSAAWALWGDSSEGAIERADARLNELQKERKFGTGVVGDLNEGLSEVNKQLEALNEKKNRIQGLISTADPVMAERLKVGLAGVEGEITAASAKQKQYNAELKLATDQAAGLKAQMGGVAAATGNALSAFLGLTRAGRYDAAVQELGAKYGKTLAEAAGNPVAIAQAKKAYQELRAELDNSFKPAVSNVSKGVSEAQRAFEKATEAAASFGESLSKRLAEEGLDEFGKLRLEAEKLAKPLADSTKQLDDWTAQIDKLRSAKFAREELDRLNKTFAEAAKANADLVASARQEAEIFGLSKVEIAQLNLAKKELLLTDLQREAASGAGINTMDTELKLLKDQIAAMREALGYQQQLADAEFGAEQAKIAADAARKSREEWQKTADSMTQGISDALMRGFESGKDAAKNFRDSLVNMFKSTVLQPLVKIGVVGGINALGLGGIAGTANAATQNTEMLNTLSSGLGTLLTKGAGLLGIGQIGTSASALGLGLGTASVAGQGATAAASSLATSLGGLASGITAAVPYIGLAIAAFSLLKGAFKGETRSGAGFSANAAGQIWQSEGPSGGDFTGGAAGKSLAEMIKTANGILNAVGSTVSVTGAYGGLETSTRGKGGVFAGGTLSDGSVFGKTFAQSFRGNFSADEAAKAYSAELNGAIIDALSKSDIPAAVRSIIDAGGDVGEMVAKISAQATQVQQFSALIALMPFGNLANLGYDAKDALLALNGGLEGLSGSINSYYQNFYSESERSAQALKNMTDSLSGVGVAVPATRDAFRALVDSQDLTSESGRKTYSTLLQVAGTFAELNPILNDTANAAKSFKEVASERYGLETQLLQLQGNTVALREREKNALDASNWALFDQITALQDQKAALDGLSAAASSAFAGLERSVAAEKTAAGKALNVRLDALQAQKDAETKAFDDQKALLIKQNSDQLQAMRTQADNLASGYRSQIDAARGVADRWRSLAGEVTSAYDRVTSGSVQFGELRYAQAKQALAQALDLSRKGQFNPSEGFADQLKGLDRLDEGLFGSQQDFLREQLRVAGMLRELGSAATGQISSADRQIALLEQSLSAVQSSGSASIAAFEKSSADQLGLLDAQHKDNQQKLDDQIKLEKDQFDANIERLDGLLVNAKEALEIANGTWQETRDLKTAHQQYAEALVVLMQAQGERSSAAEARIEQLAQANADLLAELKALRSDAAAQNRAIAENTASTAKVLKRWENEGQPEVRT
ncbi:hypothetical protein [Chitinibacter sp. GC72]|uniref:hypothetical protein n=1 Tax=Chitinibacter sp. GC72 TaxID=1526917 RepID=UPI0012FAAB19|nr:hypothetical protein [Chitinibacter sp. GC72]